MARGPREPDAAGDPDKLRARIEELEATLSQLQGETANPSNRTFMDFLPVAVYWGRPAEGGTFTYANQAMADLFGFETVDELLAAKPVSDWIGDIDRRSLLDELRREGSVRDLELEVQRRDGKRIWVSWTASAHLDDAGEIDWIEGVMEDITDRKEAQEALRSSNERLYHVIQNMPILLDAFDDTGAIQFWNRESERVTGYSAEEIVGNPRALALLYPDEDYREPMLREMQEWVERGGDFRSWEWELTCKDGSKRTIAWSNVAATAPIPPWWSWAVGVDVTERRRAEAELQRRMGLEELIATIASDFLRLPADEVESGMQEALRTASEFTGADRSWLSLVDPAEATMQPLLAWCRNESIGQAGEEFRGRSLNEFPWAWAQLQRREPVAIDCVESLPPEADATRECMVRLGMQSILLVPLCRDGTVVGLMGFDCLVAQCSWPTGIVGLLLLLGEVFSGVLQRKEAEEALRESERKYRILAEGTKDVVYTADLEGTITYIGPQVAQYGRRPEEIIGRPFFEQVAFEDRERMVAELRRTIETGEEFPSEFRVIDHEGRGHWVEERGRVQRDQEGRPVGIAGVLRDITDRKRAEAALRDSEEKYRLLVESAGEAIATISAEGIFTFVNGIGASRLGGKPEDFIGKRMADLFPPEVAKQQATVVGRVIRTGQGEVHEDITVVEDQQRWYRTSIEPIRRPDGRPIAALVIARDITRQREADMELRRAHRDLMNAREAERRHLARELHDSVGQGLVAMQLALQGAVAAGGGRLEVEQAAGLTSMADKCSELIREVRGICYGLYPPALESLGLVPALRQMGRYCEPNMAFELQCSQALEKLRMAPNLEIALFRVAQEAVNNALRHSDGDRIEVRLERRRGRVLLSVHDNGHGFDATDRTSRGLGLRTMQDRARAVEGTVEVDSGPQGTTVLFSASLVERAAGEES